MPNRPNILWFSTDQQRWDTIHYLGNPYIDTPNLDKLCKNGVAFENAYCQSPICTPSRSSFMTGRYPSAINANINGAANLPEHCTLISKALSDAGYSCGLVGKLHITSAWDDYEERADDGFSYFCYNLGPGHHLLGENNCYVKWLMEKKIEWRDIFTNDKKHNYYWYKEDTPTELRQSYWCYEKAVDFISSQDKEKPWMLCVNCYDPHPPCDAPSNMVKKYLRRKIPDPLFSDKDIGEGTKLKDYYFQSQLTKPNDDIRIRKASYYAMVEIVDRHFGLIMDYLMEKDLIDNTIVIFCSDHGEMLGDHGYTHKGCRFYEGLVHVPLIISCPSRFKKDFKYKGITELTDISATIADICELDGFAPISGKSLKEALQGTVSKHRDFVRTEYYGVLDESGVFGVSNETMDTNASDPNSGFESHAEMYFDGKYKISIYHGIEHGELYDIVTDPNEENNLWDDESYLKIKLKLMQKAFASSVVLSRPGQVRIGRY